MKHGVNNFKMVIFNNIKFAVFLITLISLVQVLGHKRVIGGDEAPSHFGSFHASLQNLTGYHVCGGAVVSSWHVLTAAHCLDGASPDHIIVAAGTTNLDVGRGRYNAVSIHIHKDFDYSTKVNDIGLIKVNKPFDLNHVSVIHLNKNHLVEGDTVFLSGFGAQVVNGESSNQMHYLVLPVFSQETCIYAMRLTREVTDSMFCTFTKVGQGTCKGDSGSPIIKNGRLVGLVSWGIPCAIGFPDVHVRLTPFIDWIHSEIGYC